MKAHPGAVPLSFPTRRSSDLDLARLGRFHPRREVAQVGEQHGDLALLALDRHPPRQDLVAHLARDRKSTRLNSSHVKISYAVFCLKKKTLNTLEHSELLATKG